jgi:hypothetical protein
MSRPETDSIKYIRALPRVTANDNPEPGNASNVVDDVKIVGGMEIARDRSDAPV